MTLSKQNYEDRKAFFNERAQEWLDMWYADQATGAYTKFNREFLRLFSLVPIKQGDHVLDVGCGSGVLVPYIMEKISFTGSLYEIDYAEEMIRENKRLHHHPRIHFLVSDAAAIPLQSNTCSLAICFCSFPHFPEKARVINTVARLLTRNGCLAIAHFSSSQELNHHHRKSNKAVMHDMLPDRASMRRLFTSAGITVETVIDEPQFYLFLGKKTN